MAANCSKCGGSGKIEKEIDNRSVDTIQKKEKVDCDRCGGSGKEPIGFHRD